MFAGQVFVDLERAVFRGAGTARTSAASLCRLDFCRAVLRAIRRGHSWNVRGDGWQLGGVFVVNPAAAGDGAIPFLFRQQHFEDLPPLHDVLAEASRGLPAADEEVADRAGDEVGVVAAVASDQECDDDLDRLLGGPVALHLFSHSQGRASARARRALDRVLDAPFSETALDQLDEPARSRLVRALRKSTDQDRPPWVFERKTFVGNHRVVLFRALDGSLDGFARPRNSTRH